MLPFIDTVSAWIDQRTITTSFAAEQTLTSDTVPVNVDAVLFWMVHDAKKAALEVQHYAQAVSWAAQTALRDIVKRYPAKELQDVFEREGLPYAPIVRPEQLFDDPHLLASGGLAELTLDSGDTTPVPLLPLLLGGRHLKPRMALPKVGQHNAELPIGRKTRAGIK